MSFFNCKAKIKKTGRVITFGAEYPGEDRTVEEMKAHVDKHLQHLEWVSGEVVETRPPQTGPMPEEAITHGIKSEMLATAKAVAGVNANAGDAAGGEPQAAAADVKAAPSPAAGTAAANAAKK